MSPEIKENLHWCVGILSWNDSHMALVTWTAAVLYWGKITFLGIVTQLIWIYC